MSTARPPRPVLVARPPGRGDAAVSQLRALGLEAEHQALIRLVPVDPALLAEPLAALAAGEHTHLVVTSRTAVDALGRVTVPATTQVVAVGEGTAEALGAAGVRVDLVAAGSGQALVELLPSAAPGDWVLFPASAAASRTVPEGLRAKGYRVREVAAYRPEPAAVPPSVAKDLAAGHYGAIVLTSPMIARRAAELGVHPSTAVVTIGAPTSAAARAAGLVVGAQAAEPTDAALARAVQQVLTADPALPGPHRS